MNCQSIPIQPNPRDLKYVSEEYLNDWHKNQTASRWAYDKPNQLDQILPWPEIKGMDTSAVDVVSSKIRPHRFQRYNEGWARVAKQRVCSETWLLHVNTKGYYVSEQNMLVGIPTLIVKIYNEIDIREFEEVAVYQVSSVSEFNGPLKIKNSSLQHSINIEGRNSFKPIMDKLATVAGFGLNHWGQ